MGVALKLLREFLERIGIEIDKKTAASLLVLLLVLTLLPVGLFLIKNRQIFTPKAAGELIQLGEGGCIRVNKDKQKVVDCTLVPLKLTNPFFKVNAVSPSSSSRSSASPAASRSPGPSNSASASPSAPPAGGPSPLPSPSISPSPSPPPTGGPSPSASAGTPKNVNVRSFNNNIQAALNSIKQSGGSVYLPSGTYTIREKIRLYSNTTLFGDGMDQTILSATPQFQSGREAMISNDSSRGLANVVVRDMTLNGGLSAQADKLNGNDGIKFRDLNGGFIYRVKVTQFGDHGIWLSYKPTNVSPGYKAVYNVRVSDCQSLRNKGAGIWIDSGERNVVDNCKVSAEGDANGIGFEIGIGGKLSNNMMISNDVQRNGHGISLTAGNFDNYTAGMVNSDNIVCYNIVKNNRGPGVWDQKGRNNVYIGNEISNNNNNDGHRNVINVNSFGYEEKLPPATDLRCNIPSSISIPAAPAKPTAERENKLVNSKGFVKEVLAQTTGNPGSDKLRYRLAESQDGLEQAPWQEIAFLPNQDVFASYDQPLSLTKLFKDFSNKVTPLVLAKDSDDVFIDPQSSPSPSPTGGPSPSPSPSPTGGPSPSPSGTPTFSIGPQFINTSFQLTSSQIGVKQIWVQFLHPDGTTKVGNVNFNLVEKPPQILGLACNLDISKENLKITIEGDRFGTGVGTVDSLSPAVKPEVLGWNDKQIIALLKKPNIPINEGQRFKIKLTRTDGFESNTAICAVDKSLISLGARIFCREPGKFDTSNVIVNIIYNPSDPANPNKLNKIEEKVTINADGEITNLKTKLQAGKNYALAIKAPNSLRRATTFTAQEGTTEISQSDGNPFILPIGDIAPPISPDGRINTLDRSELIRQWRILGQGKTTLTGDFNRDSRVNSIDWACMRYDFGAEDDPIPVAIPQSASGTIKIPEDDTAIIPSVSPSPQIACAADVRLCPDGSYVRRIPPTCQFETCPPRDTSNAAKIDVGGKIFLDTNRNRIPDFGESFIGQGGANVKLLQVPEDHVVGTPLTAGELGDSRILAQVINNLPGANYDISVFVDKDTSNKFSVLATANIGQLTGTIDFALGTPLSDLSSVINIPVTSATQ